MRSLKKLLFIYLQIVLGATLIYYYFALILTKVYQDDGYYCDNAYSKESILTKQDCFNWGGDWVRHQLNFSNAVVTYLNFFYIGTMEGWMYFMQKMMDFNGKDKAPSYNANELFQIFFVVFFFVTGFILVNSVVSLSIVIFKNIKEKETG